jgi:hypothetical protein
MMQTMKHNFEEPCPAVRTQLETMKRFPCLQICVLDQVLSLVPVPEEQRSRAIQIRQVWHRRTLEALELNLRTKKQTTLQIVSCLQRGSGLEWQSQAAATHTLTSVN